jgi:hypothetical protein
MINNTQTIDSIQTSAIMSAGMKLLRDNLGLIECEVFVSNISRNRFDYTKWRENLWEDFTVDEVFERAKEAQARYGVPEGVEII